jgi:hypothetical protein
MGQGNSCLALFYQYGCLQISPVRQDALHGGDHLKEI